MPGKTVAWQYATWIARFYTRGQARHRPDDFYACLYRDVEASDVIPLQPLYPPKTPKLAGP